MRYFVTNFTESLTGIFVFAAPLGNHKIDNEKNMPANPLLPGTKYRNRQESKDANGKTISIGTYVWASKDGKTVITLEFVDGKLVDKNFKR